MNKTERLKLALIMKLKSEEQRELGLRETGDTRRHALGVQLLHAATAYALWSDSSKSGDFNSMVAFSQNLENAADAYALR